MQFKADTKISLQQLSALPSYAQYLLAEKLDEYVAEQISLTRMLQPPLYHLLKDLPEGRLQEIVRQSSIELLTSVANNQGQKYVDDSVTNWLENRLPEVHKNDVAVEDITLVNYIRRRVLQHFVTDYSTSTDDIIELIKEIDIFILEAESAASTAYIKILKEGIEEHSYLLQMASRTMPGAIYIADIKSNKYIYANEKLKEIIGYDVAELNQIGQTALHGMVHENEREQFLNAGTSIVSANDGDIVTSAFRLQDKSGRYHWIRSYESVFKRDRNRHVIQKIGIALNIDREHETAEQLLRRDTQLLQAQEIARMGSYQWDFSNNHINASAKTLEILDMKELNPEHFMERVFTSDRKKIDEALAQAKQTGIYDCEFRFLAGPGEKIIWSKGIVNFEQGKPAGLTGMIMDVTEKQALVQKLQQTETLYKQAEELANMGNWNWDLSTNEVKWTDQLYKIYGLEPQSEKITIDRFLSFVHPADRDRVIEGIDIENLDKKLDYTFRIISAKGEARTLRSLAQVYYGTDHRPLYVIGTERDITERQNLVEKLKQSEYLYQQAENLAKMGSWTMDLQTGDFFWSDELYKIYDIPKGEKTFSAKEWENVVHPDDRARVIEHFQAVIEKKMRYDITHRIVLKDGQEKVVHRRAEIMYDPATHTEKLIGTTQDVTEFYKIQQELKENQNFIRKITDATPSIISSYNIHTGRYVFISEGLEKLMGYRREDAMKEGVPFFVKITHPDDLPELIEKNANILEEANANPSRNDLVAEFTYRMRHSNGEYRWYHTYGTVFDRNNEGKVEHVLNITLDVTEQVNASAKIKEQEHFIQQIADASPTILYLFDVATQSMAYINREIFFVLGYVPEAILESGSDVTASLYHPDDWKLLPGRSQSERSFQQIESMIQYECRLKNKDDEWKWFLVREIVFKADDKGEIKQILGAALDINRRKEMERTILQNTLMLEQSNASLEEFAYVASHDLKEPLRKISTFGDRLAANMGGTMTPEGKIYLEKIIDASQRMQTMINDLLSISMISGNKSFETVSLQTLLSDALQTLEYKIEQQNAIIRFDPLPEAKVVPPQFRQLFQNLLSNSLKFVRPGVQPIIQVRHRKLSPVEVAQYQVAKASQYLKIEFADNGIGFENEFAGKIFAIFQRLHGKSEYEGSGIGLAICKKIVEHHGGVIFASGVPDEGATFTLIIPV